MKYYIEVIILCITAIFVYIIYSEYKNNSIIFKQNAELPSVVATPVESSDLIRGNPKASKLYIVEYIDLQCPHCQAIHPNLKSYSQKNNRVLNSEVSWVVRHGPYIDNISVKKAETVECVRKYYDDKTAWDFIDNSILVTNEPEFPLERYKNIFNHIGVTPQKIFDCLRKQELRQEINKIKKNVEMLKINKTPYIQFLTPNGELLHEEIGPLSVIQIEFIVEELIKRFNK